MAALLVSSSMAADTPRVGKTWGPVWSAVKSLEEDGQTVVVEFEDGFRHFIRGFEQPIGHLIVSSAADGQLVTVTHQMGTGGRYDCDVIYLNPDRWLVSCTVFPFIFDSGSFFLHQPEGFDIEVDTASFVMTPEMCTPTWVNCRYCKGSGGAIPPGTRTMLIAVARELARWPQEGKAALRHLLQYGSVPPPKLAVMISKAMAIPKSTPSMPSVEVVVPAQVSEDISFNFRDGEELERWLLEVISNVF
ncbi:MAG: hypothetical protein ACC742_09520 [Thermoanaerobaculales bacterium]